jgi:PAS domain S-box-containing protein
MIHVLIVDDLYENRYLLQALLEGNGYRVTAAGNGLEALAAARREPPDVIVSDAMMPKMDGFALCRAWMQDAALRVIPFIFYSATYTNAEDKRFALALGAVRYLIKPQEPEAFLGELTAVLREWAARPAPGPASPLEETAFHALYDAALSRKLEDKIAQLEAANRGLEEREERFRATFEQAAVGLAHMAPDGRWLRVNQRLCDILGYTREELLVRSFPEITHPDDLERDLGYMRQLLAAEIPTYTIEKRYLRKGGGIVWINLTVALVRKNSGDPDYFIGVSEDISEKKRAEEQIQRYVAQLESAFMSTVQVATAISEMRDPYTAGHERKVAQIAAAIGAELGFDARGQEGLKVAGYLHDIGKITIPSEILSKPGRLNPIEFQLIQGHPAGGYDVLKDVTFPWPVAAVALQHHERIDGSGYPQGLKGEAILLEARIIAVADVLEAMSSHRPYRPGLGIDKALAEIERGRGTLYDPVVTAACLKLFREKGYAIPA